MLVGDDAFSEQYELLNTSPNAPLNGAPEWTQSSC
jgi:hypothetical protein